MNFIFMCYIFVAQRTMFFSMCLCLFVSLVLESRAEAREQPRAPHTAGYDPQ